MRNRDRDGDRQIRRTGERQTDSDIERQKEMERSLTFNVQSTVTVKHKPERGKMAF